MCRRHKRGVYEANQAQRQVVLQAMAPFKDKTKGWSSGEKSTRKEFGA